MHSTYSARGILPQFNKSKELFRLNLEATQRHDEVAEKPLLFFEQIGQFLLDGRALGRSRSEGVDVDGPRLPYPVSAVGGLLLDCWIPLAGVVKNVVGGRDVKTSTCCSRGQDQNPEALPFRELLNHLEPAFRLGDQAVYASHRDVVPSDGLVDDPLLDRSPSCKHNSLLLKACNLVEATKDSFPFGERTLVKSKQSGR